MDASEDTASTTNQGHEELKQRIFQLEAELQLKEASLQNQARRIQVSTELIAKMRTELRKQTALEMQRPRQWSLRRKWTQATHAPSSESDSTPSAELTPEAKPRQGTHAVTHAPLTAVIQALSVQASEDVLATLAAPPRTTNKSIDDTSSVICVACSHRFGTRPCDAHELVGSTTASTT
ncbi:hypothetical protein AAVH_15183 [Aphelenchoides avenae]|nr:hypothetical protein AAVH_15183 [Aphelenchus avenae]